MSHNRREHMKRYFNASYDSKLHLNQHYIKGEKAIIPIHVEALSDIYSQYDKENRVLNEDLVSYIEQIAYYIPYQHSIVLEFEGMTFSEEEKETLVDVITDQFGLVTHDMTVELRYNTVKSINLFLIGCLVLALSFFLRDIEHMNYLSEILSIIGTFSIWEFVNTIWFERKMKKIDKMNSGQLSSCTVAFVED